MNEGESYTGRCCCFRPSSGIESAVATGTEKTTDLISRVLVFTDSMFGKELSPLF